MPTIPPDTVAEGQTGHLDAHNNISDVLTAQQTQLSGIPALKAGTAALVAGTVSVSLSSVGTGTIVLVSRLVPGGTMGHLSVPTVSNGTGFTIASTSVSETSTVAWLAIG
jgi:hypothetical protein